ncbi:MAG: carboxypeptidase-like regulatory domain-containing protein [Gemmatimonadetes bacterium]|nr:carboxypeptidase-like regulatory domain-containing protein [Gemmatimonadota bacterium]
MRARRIFRGPAAACACALVALCGLTLSAQHAAGQALVSGTLEGTVRDLVDRPMFAVTVTLTSQTSGRRWIVRTDRAGRYTIESLAAGSYDALFERLGYEPERVENIAVHPGTRRDLSIRLLAAEGPAVQTRVRIAEPAVGIAGLSGPDRWTTGETGTASLPFDASDLTATVATSSLSGTRLDVEGLPLWMNTILIDGIPAVQRLDPAGFRARAAAFPVSTLSIAQLTGASADVEYAGSPGTYLSGATRPAGATFFRLWGDGSTDALAVGGTDIESFQSYRMGGLLGGALVRDTAGVLIGAEYSKSVIPYASVWTPDAGAIAIQDAARDRYGVDVSAWVRPSVQTAERFSGFARLDLRLGESSSLNLRGLFASQPTATWMLPHAAQPVAANAVAKATDWFGAATLVSSLSEGAASNELNLGFELSRFEREDGTGAMQDLPATRIAGAAREFGDPSDRVTRSTVWSGYARNTLTIPTGGHRFKIGVAFTLPSYDLTSLFGTAGTFHYSGASEFTASDGYFAGIDGTASQREWTHTRIVLFGQDSWKATPEIEVLAGTRLSFTRNPDSLHVSLADTWLRLTGLSNRLLEKRDIELEPRFMVTYRPAGSGLVLTGVVQVDAELIDPALIAEQFTRDGSLGVRRGFGRFTSYPDVLDTDPATREGPTVSLLGPDFQGPRSSRVAGSITRAVGDVALSVSATYRKTEFLAQRKDLNLLPAAASRDQFGRPIYGQLQKQGSLLFADGESSRRFPEFDEVWGLQATGVSTYRGITVIAERQLRGPIGFRASYTYSTTEDDWLMGVRGDPRSQLDPFPDSAQASDWANGRSDLDVPHRAVIGAEIQVPGRYGPRLAAIYRYQSGYPFTPGFRDGVDANADGSASNDPAFLSAALAGTSELVAEWSCLAAHMEAFVERNACRGPAIHSLDGRITIGITSGDRYNAEIVVDALNLVAPEDIVPDRAVYLVDPSSDLAVSPNGRNTTVPLVVNPGFGEAVARYAPQRLIRLGLRLSW